MLLLSKVRLFCNHTSIMAVYKGITKICFNHRINYFFYVKVSVNLSNTLVRTSPCQRSVVDSYKLSTVAANPFI